MNRKLKFRCWHEDEKAMLHNFWLDSKDGCIQASDDNDQPLSQNHHIMQFTGLLDSKGKEIFEGDIIGGIFGIGRRDGKPSVIDFTYGVFGFQGISFAEGANEYNWTIENAEILGNIFENKDLLKDHLIK